MNGRIDATAYPLSLRSYFLIGLVWSPIPRKLSLMEYRGIRYTIRSGIERGQWHVVIHPKGVEVPANKIFGTREDAEVHAHRMINRWLEPKSRQRTNRER
jgi:hypothetical protein